MNEHQIIITTAIIPDGTGKLLLSQRNEPSSPNSHNKWQFIGGGINFGEDPETAIVREVLEEAGIEVEPVRLFPKVFTHVWDIEEKQTQILILTYECKLLSGTPTPSDQETKALEYFTLEEILELDTLPQIKEAAQMFLLQSKS